jgi:hypothetical protein
MQEEDPTATDPDELPPKPPIEEPMPTDEELAAAPEPGEEDVPEDDVLPPDEADADDTVDNAEQEDSPAA